MKDLLCGVRNGIFILLVLLIPVRIVSAQSAGKIDSVSITLTQAGNKFLQNNLQLLSARYNINAASAAILQAKLWNNPNITIGQNIYNKNTGRYFDFTKTGNTDIQLQQLFLLAGKRDKQIKLAETNTRIAEDSFYDLLRALRYELSSDFFNVFYLQQSLKFYNETIPSVEKTISVAESMYSKRSILLSELIRLKSLLFSLENDRLHIKNEISDAENDLNVMLRDTTSIYMYIIPNIDPGKIDSLSLNNLSLKNILESAVENRPDYKIVSENVKYDKENIALQKAMAIPDVTLGGSYSRNGSYIPDYFGINASIDIPLFNRNQGNISIAKNNMEADIANREQTRIEIKKEIISAFEKARTTDQLYKEFDKKFIIEYKELLQGMIANYENRNMTLIEFTDFFDSYRSTMTQLIQLQNDRINAFENLNYATGMNLFNQ